MELKLLEGINRDELSSVEVAFAILQETGEVMDFNELLVHMQEYLSWSEQELEDNMVRVYTHLNVDGRFISLGDNRWGLRAWYPIDSIDEEIVSSIDDEDLPEKQRPTIDIFGDEGGLIDYSADDPEDQDLYDDDEYEYDPALDTGLDSADDDEEDDDGLGELVEYADDLSELGDDGLDLDDESSDFSDELDETDEDDEDDEDFDDF